MNILVTGSSGFIGSHVVREALTRGHHVFGASRSSRRPTSEDAPTLSFLQWDLSVDGSTDLDGMRIDAVIHLAAMLEGNPQTQYTSIVAGTKNLLDAMRKAQINTLVGVSSIAILDYAAVRAHSVIDETVPICSDQGAMGTYAKMKVEQESLFDAFASEPNHRCVILRPGLVFDEGRIIPAHAGFRKGLLQLLVEHDGEVPVVAAGGVAIAALTAVERDIPSGEVIHLVDDKLPTQHAYIDALRRRHLLSNSGIRLSWKNMASVARIARAIAGGLHISDKLPDGLLEQSVAARVKPLRYSNAKAKELLGWTPASSFS